jgi:serine/threonine protein phosphatase 1
MSGRLLAISDIHGCYKTFYELLNIVGLNQSDELVILGDMINRGSDSKSVLKTIIKLKKSGYNIKCIRGNHEQMLLDVIEKDPLNLYRFLKTYHSENLLNLKGEIKKKFVNFLNELPYYYSTDEYIFVHAALDLTLEDIFSDKTFMLFSRYQKGNTKALNGKRLIHGHVASNLEIIKNNFFDNTPILGIDNGCVYKNSKPGLGKLVCIDFTNKEIFAKENCD